MTTDKDLFTIRLSYDEADAVIYALRKAVSGGDDDQNLASAIEIIERAVEGEKGDPDED